MNVDFAKYLKEKLDEISPNSYDVSNERNLDTDYSKHQVVVSALAGNVFEESMNIPYQIDITTTDIEKVMFDFMTLAKNNNNVSFSQIVKEGESYQSYSITPFFNTPVVMEKDIPMGSDKYARIVVFASAYSIYNVNNVEKITIDGESIKFLNANLVYTAELKSNKISGSELSRSKKFMSSTLLTFNMVNKANVFNNKFFQIATGTLKGNNYFNVEIELTNGLKATMKMIVGNGALNSTRGQLTSNQVNLYLYDDRGDEDATS